MNKSIKCTYLDIVLKVLLGIFLIVFLFFFITDINGFTTEETLTLTKLTSNNNFTESQTITFFDLIAKDENTISNETTLINNLEDDFQEYKENLNENISIIYLTIEDLKTEIFNNLSNLVIEESQVDIYQAKIDLVNALNTPDQTEDPFETLLNELTNKKFNEEKIITTQPKTNLTNYYTKETIDLKFENILLKQNQTSPTYTKQEIDTKINQIPEQESLSILYILIVVPLGAVAFLYFEQIKLQKKLERILNKRQKNNETPKESPKL